MSKSNSTSPATDSEATAPEHVAIIMDGNGRWAKERGLPRVAGHRSGAKSVQRTVEGCVKLGVKYLTLYAFSSENWKRPASEVKALMQLLEKFLKEKTKEMMQQNVRLNPIGRLDMLPEKTRAQLAKAVEKTAGNTALTLNLALSYGAREEIVDATKLIAAKVASGEMTLEQIDNDTVSNHLYTAGQPDPDLLIRTSGENRLSNFLLWQLSYAEFVILDKFWPDFCAQDLEDAVAHFNRRSRRFGAL